MSLMSQSIASGVLIGGGYALLWRGMSMNWGVLKIINLGHFSFILLCRMNR